MSGYMDETKISRVCDAAIIIVGESGAACKAGRRYLNGEGIQATVADDVQEVIARARASADAVPVFFLAHPANLDALVDDLSNACAGAGMREIELILLSGSASTGAETAPMNMINVRRLAMPLRKGELGTAVRAAQRAMEDRQALRHYIREHPIPAAGRILAGTFQIRDLEQARNLATMLAQNYPEPDLVGIGIWELLSNAVEHGNLEIDCEMKRRLIENGTFGSEVARRLGVPEFALRLVTIEFKHNPTKLELRIKDEGKGFDFRLYANNDRVDDSAPNGRGMMIATEVAFHQITYLGCGNEVVATYELPKAKSTAAPVPDTGALRRRVAE